MILTEDVTDRRARVTTDEERVRSSWLNRYEITKTSELGCSENFVGQREELVLNTFFDLQPVKRSKKGRDMRELGSVKTARAREF